jgi:hypothetical protein
MKNRFKIALALCALQVFCLCRGALAQQGNPTESQSSESSTKSVSQAQAAPVDLQTAVKTLADQVVGLGAEVRRLRRATEKNSLYMELLLSEERLARLEDKIESLQDVKRALDARERQQHYRLDNIQQEVLLRGGLDREATEKAVRGDIQSQLDDIHSQQAGNQRRLTDLQSQSRRLQARVEELRRRLDGEEKDQQQQ